MEVNGISLEAIYRWNIPKQVPLNGEISFAELARKVSQAEPTVRRIIRYAIVWHRVFHEPRIGHVAHSSASRLLVEDPEFFDGLGLMFEETWKAFSRTCDAIEQFGVDDPERTGFAIAHNTNTTLWNHYKVHPALGKRFAGAMKSATFYPGHSLSFLVSGYPWYSLSPQSTIVDVGGSEGHASIAIAKEHPHLNFIVQGLPDVIDKAPKVSSSSAEATATNRIEYMAHDFFTPQTREGDIYLFRWIFHDWPDSYVVKILRNLVPALKPAAKIVINEQLMPAPGTVPLLIERQIRAFDMTMLSLFNGRERDESDWKALFAEADQRFQDFQLWTPSGSAFAIVEVTWTP
ncbi:MAG: hypothetical protein Q9160_004231 [Pyrenula sp. 1 TL-2023]